MWTLLTARDALTIPNDTCRPAKDRVNYFSVAQLEQGEEWIKVNDLLHFSKTKMLGS